MVNFAAANPAWTMKAEVFEPGPDIVIGGGKEAWKLTCHSQRPIKTQKVYVDRGRPRERRQSLPVGPAPDIREGHRALP